MATIKKKIELYVSENTGNTKTTGYYRIPLKGDSLPFNKETNLFKNCVRFYAKVAGDIVYYAAFSRIPCYVAINNGGSVNGDYGRDVLKGEVSDELFSNTIPQLPSELINNNESYIETDFLDTQFNSRKGLTRLCSDINPFVNISRDSLFSLSNAIISDEYLNLLEFVPSNWTRLNSIDDLINDINTFMTNSYGVEYLYDIDDTNIFKYYYISNPNELEIGNGDKSIIVTNNEPNLEVGVSKTNLTNGKDARYLITKIDGLTNGINIDTSGMTGKVRLVSESSYNLPNIKFENSQVVNPGENVQYKMEVNDMTILNIVFENPADATKLKITRNKFEILPGKTFETVSGDDIFKIASMSDLLDQATNLRDDATIPSSTVIFDNDDVMILRGGDFSYNTQKVTITDISTEADFAKAYILDRNLRSVSLTSAVLNKTNVDSELENFNSRLHWGNYLLIIKDPTVTFNVKTSVK